MKTKEFHCRIESLFSHGISVAVLSDADSTKCNIVISLKSILKGIQENIQSLVALLLEWKFWINSLSNIRFVNSL